MRAVGERELWLSLTGACLEVVLAGKLDESFRWLDRALEEASPLIAMARIDPQLDPIRSDPRFAEFLRRIRTPLAD